SAAGGLVIAWPNDQPPPQVPSDLELGNRLALRRLLIRRIYDAEQLGARANERRAPGAELWSGHKARLWLPGVESSASQWAKSVMTGGVTAIADVLNLVDVRVRGRPIQSHRLAALGAGGGLQSWRRFGDANSRHGGSRKK